MTAARTHSMLMLAHWLIVATPWPFRVPVAYLVTYTLMGVDIVLAYWLDWWGRYALRVVTYWVVWQAAGWPYGPLEWQYLLSCALYAMALWHTWRSMNKAYFKTGAK